MKLRELTLQFLESQNTVLDYPANLGKRSKLGGKPLWIQEQVEVKCNTCKQEMVFVSQLDSIDYTGLIDSDGEYIFGDVGMIYTFFCFDCTTVRSLFQSY